MGVMLFNLLFVIGGLLDVGWINYVLFVIDFSVGYGINFYFLGV